MDPATKSLIDDILLVYLQFRGKDKFLCNEVNPWAFGFLSEQLKLFTGATSTDRNIMDMMVPREVSRVIRKNTSSEQRTAMRWALREKFLIWLFKRHHLTPDYNELGVVVGYKEQ